MSQERMQSVKEGEVESELRGIKMDSQKQGVDQTPLMQQPSDAQRFTNIGGSTGQQTSSLQQQQSGQIPLTSQQPQQLSTGQQFSQQASSIPQQPLGIQQPVQQQQQPQQIGSQYGQQGLQQSGTQPLQQVGTVQQQQQQQPQQQTPSGPSYATYEDIVIQDPAYEPVLRIANMQDAQRIAFLQPYRLVKFDGQFIQRSDKAGSLVPLSNAVAARIVCFPIPFAPQPSSTQDEHLGVTGGDKLAAASTTTQQQMPLSTSGQQVPLQPQQQQQQQQPLSQQVQQQHTLPPTLGQAAVASTQQQQQQPQQFRSSGPAAAGITQVQQYRNTSVVNTMGLEIQMTSQVWELVPQDASEIIPGFWEKAKNPTIKSPLSLGRLLFLNTSHIESSSARTSAPWIEKPARHTLVFGPTSDAPVLIVERDLKFVRKCIRVFDSDLRSFCKIEGTNSFLRKKIVITGPDEDTPIYTIKSKGYSGPFKGFSSIGGTSTDEPNFIIYQNKRAVGCITSRYIPNNTLPGQMISTTQNENMAYDVFFPYGSSWAPRAALLIAALFFDYLWSDKGE